MTDQSALPANTTGADRNRQFTGQDAGGKPPPVRSGRGLRHRLFAIRPEDEGRDLACVVVLRDADRRAAACLRSLLAQATLPQVVVVAFGSYSPFTLFETFATRVRFLYHGGPLSGAAACNLGIAASSAPCLAFLCAGHAVDPGWVARRIEALRAVQCEHGTAALVDGRSSSGLALGIAAAAAGVACAERWIACTRPLLERFGGFDESADDHPSEFLARLDADVAVRASGGGDVRQASADGFAAGLGSLYLRARGRAFACGAPAGLALTRRMVRTLGRVVGDADAAGKARAALALPALAASAASVVAGRCIGSWRRRQHAAALRVPPGKIFALLQVRNAMRYLPEYLANAEGKVDGIFALDDGSDDGTVELLRESPLVTRLIEKPRSNRHVWDEPANRQRLVTAARDRGARWVIALDADERLPGNFRDRLAETLATARRRNFVACSLWLRELWDDPRTYRVDGVWGSKHVARLFDVSRVGRLDDDRFHGQWAPARNGLLGRYLRSDLEIYHLAMIDPRDREARRRRYERLDPNGDWQPIGYAYLTDETGCVCRAIDPAALYAPLSGEA